MRDEVIAYAGVVTAGNGKMYAYSTHKTSPATAANSPGGWHQECDSVAHSQSISTHRLCAHCGAPFTAQKPSSRQRFCAPTCWYECNRRPLADRFSKFVDRSGECWLWTGHGIPRGYGQIWDWERKRLVYAHRAAYEMAAGSIPPGFDVLHTCDVPSCVRNEPFGVYTINGVDIPAYGHLFLGTTRSNMRDMANKGRNGPQLAALARIPRRGESNTQAKLTEVQVLEIRDACGAGAPQKAISAQYGVTVATVRAIVGRRIWSWLP